MWFPSNPNQNRVASKRNDTPVTNLPATPLREWHTQRGKEEEQDAQELQDVSGLGHKAKLRRVLLVN